MSINHKRNGENQKSLYTGQWTRDTAIALPEAAAEAAHYIWTMLRRLCRSYL